MTGALGRIPSISVPTSSHLRSKSEGLLHTRGLYGDASTTSSPYLTLAERQLPMVPEFVVAAGVRKQLHCCICCNALTCPI